MKVTEREAQPEDSVYARKRRAISLYEKSSFQVEGRRRKAIYQDRIYVDDLLMALLL